MESPDRPRFSERVVPFTAGDGMACNLVNVRPEAPTKGWSCCSGGMRCISRLGPAISVSLLAIGPRRTRFLSSSPRARTN